MIDLFKFMKPYPPKLLEKGQTVYLIQDGDVISAEVLEDDWICNYDDELRGYWIIREDSQQHFLIWDDDIGKCAFLDSQSVQKAADEIPTAMCKCNAPVV